jgi:hypothetical protein
MAAGGIVRVVRHALAFVAAGVFCAAFSWAGANPVAPMPLALMAAVYWATRRTWLGGAAIACAVALGAFVTLRVQAGAFYGLFMLAGVALGYGLRREWPFGVLVATVTAWAFGVFAAFVAFLLTWEGWKRQAAASYEQLAAQMRETTEIGPDQQRALDVFRWLLIDHWGDVSLGLMVASLLVCAALATGLTAAWLRLRHGLPGPRTTFARMRPPEWLVWPAILCAVLWFVEQRVPNGLLQAFTWNAGIGLAAIYWLNGLSLVVYAVRRLQPNVFIVIALVLLMMYAGVWLLGFFGLFDTWWAFRAKVDRLVAARDKLREGRGDDE